MRSPVPDSRNIDGLVEDDQHRLEPAQQAIEAPVLGQFDCRAARDCRDIARASTRTARRARTESAAEPAKPGEDLVAVKIGRILRAGLLDHRRDRR